MRVEFWLAPRRVAVFAGVSFASATGARAVDLPCGDAPGLHVAFALPEITRRDRVEAFRIDIQNGYIKALPAIPEGWTLAIDNDTDGRTSLAGHGIHYGRFFDTVRTLECLVVLGRTSKELRSTGDGGNPVVSGELTLYRDDTERILAFGPDRITLTRVPAPPP